MNFQCRFLIAFPQKRSKAKNLKFVVSFYLTESELYMSNKYVQVDLYKKV